MAEYAALFRPTRCQVIMATHSPVLMAYPDATLLKITKYGLEPTIVEQTCHCRALQEFSYGSRGVWKRRLKSKFKIAYRSIIYYWSF